MAKQFGAKGTPKPGGRPAIGDGKNGMSKPGGRPTGGGQNK